MRKLFNIFFAAFFLFSCATIPVKKTYECDIYLQYGATEWNSLIANKIKDPCKALKIIVTATKLPAVKWKKDYIQRFEAWAATMAEILADNISYFDLQLVIVDAVATLNRDVGLTMLIVTDGILIFNERALLMPKDAELLTALVDHLRDEIKKMEVAIQ